MQFCRGAGRQVIWRAAGTGFLLSSDHRAGMHVRLMGELCDYACCRERDLGPSLKNLYSGGRTTRLCLERGVPGVSL